MLGDPNGTRTRVAGVRGRSPRPLDDGALDGLNVVNDAAFFVKDLLNSVLINMGILSKHEILP